MRTHLLAAILAVAAALTAAEAVAQADPAIDPATAPAIAVAPATTPVQIPSGMPVVIEITETISSKLHRRGDTFRLRLAGAIVVDGKVVVPAGVQGMGQVVDSAKAGLIGKPAKLVVAARYLEVDGRRLPLRGLKLGLTGIDNTNLVMAATMVPYAGVLGVFIRGGEIEITPGTLGAAKVAGDLIPSTAVPPSAPAPIDPAATPPASSIQP